MKIQGKLTISRPIGGSGPGEIRITLEDPIAVIQFVEARVSLEGFTEAITGRGYVDCELDLRGLDRVGMIREIKPLEFELPARLAHKRGERQLAEELCDSFAEEGWVADGYFGSQSSIQHRDGKRIAVGRQVRWVPREPTPTKQLRKDRA